MGGRRYQAYQTLMGTSQQRRSVNPEEVLAELYALMEEYAPTWYAEKQYDHVLDRRRPRAEVLLELVTLLEEYAPTWYTEKRGRAMDALRVLEVLGLGARGGLDSHPMIGGSHHARDIPRPPGS